MAKKDRINIDNTGVDKLETFLQHNIKKIIILITGLLVLFIAVYIIYSTQMVSKNKKIDTIGIAEVSITNSATVNTFVSLAGSVPSLKDYIYLRGAEMYYLYDNKTATIAELKKVGGKFSEFSAGMLYDLGEPVKPSDYQQGSMRELWHYRTVLSSDNNSIDANINNFKLLYPESALLKMVENWNIK